MSVREELKKCRKEHNLSQEELAKNISVSVKDIEKWENALGLPSEENIDALANYFGKPKESFTPNEEEEALVGKRRKSAKRIRIFQIVGYCLLLSFLGICLFLVILHSKKSYLFESDRVLWIDDYCVYIDETSSFLSRNGDSLSGEISLSEKEAEEVRQGKEYDYELKDIERIKIHSRFWFFSNLNEAQSKYIPLYDKSEEKTISAGSFEMVKDHNGICHYFYVRESNIVLDSLFSYRLSKIGFYENPYVTINGNDIKLEYDYYFKSEVDITDSGVDFTFNGSTVYFSK